MIDCLRMYFILISLILVISYGNNISASDHQSQINYFVNKEIFDKVVEKEKIFLPQTEGKIKQYNCQLSIIAYADFEYKILK